MYLSQVGCKQSVHPTWGPITCKKMATGCRISHTLSQDPFTDSEIWNVLRKQCGFKMKPSTSFWSIWDSMYACATLLNRWATKHSSRWARIWDLLFCFGTHTSFEFSTSMAHGVRWGEGSLWSFYTTPSVALATLGDCHIFNKQLLLESEPVKSFPELMDRNRRKTLHHWKVTMYSIRFAYHVKDILKEMFEKGCHNMVWWIENSNLENVLRQHDWCEWPTLFYKKVWAASGSLVHIFGKVVFFHIKFFINIFKRAETP